MDYLTYEEYVNIGGILDFTAFSRNIDRACGMIDNATDGKITEMVEAPSSVKSLCRDLVEFVATNMNSAEKSVNSWSQSAGAVSENVSYAQKTKEALESEAYGIISDHIGMVTNDNGVLLLYRGAER